MYEFYCTNTIQIMYEPSITTHRLLLRTTIRILINTGFFTKAIYFTHRTADVTVDVTTTTAVDWDLTEEATTAFSGS